MPNRTCSVDGCERPARERGWCMLHYGRWYRQGDPLAAVADRAPRGEPRTCSVQWCDRPVNRDGLCHSHYRRLLRGIPLDVPFRPHGMTLEQAVRRHLAIGTPEDCWPAKSTTAKGYGTFRHGGRHWKAHRASWIVFIGPLDDGLELHHLCHNRVCGNPAHMQPMTAAEHSALHH